MTESTAARSPAPLDPEGSEPFVDHPGGAAYSGLNGNGFHRAIEGTGAALHAEIDISNLRLAFPNQEEIVRTDFRADPAADADFTVQNQGRNPFQVGKAFQRNLPTRTSRSPASRKIACRGRAHFISFLTPDLEVYGVEPVKLSIRNELTAAIIRVIATM